MDDIDKHLDGMDEGADFCTRTLAKKLGVDNWEQGDGTEDWEGDVALTIHNILVVANIIDPDTNERIK